MRVPQATQRRPSGHVCACAYERACVVMLTHLCTPRVVELLQGVPAQLLWGRVTRVLLSAAAPCLNQRAEGLCSRLGLLLCFNGSVARIRLCVCLHMLASMRACVCVCMCACMLASVRACVGACVQMAHLPCRTAELFLCCDAKADDPNCRFINYTHSV